MVELGKPLCVLRGEFVGEGVESDAGGFQLFGPDGLRGGYPTHLNSLQIFGESGIEPQFGRRKGHGRKIIKWLRGCRMLESVASTI